MKDDLNLSLNILLLALLKADFNSLHFAYLGELLKDSRRNFFLEPMIAINKVINYELQLVLLELLMYLCDMLKEKLKIAPIWVMMNKASLAYMNELLKIVLEIMNKYDLAYLNDIMKESSRGLYLD